jgi:PEGA domain
MSIPRTLGCVIRRNLVVALVLFTVLIPWAARPQNPRKPVSKDEVVQLLKGGVPSVRVIDIVRERGITFDVTQEVEEDLGAAGATEQLLAMLRKLAPKPTRTVIETSPDALVYVDGEFQGQASSQGRLVIVNLKPGAHTLKVSQAGRKDLEQPITVVAGQEATVRAVFEELGASPSGRFLSGTWRGTVTQDKPADQTFLVVMELRGASGGTIDYPTFTCGGQLEFRGVEGPIFSYTEHITYGKDNCVDGGTLKVTPQGNSLRWHWSGEGITAVGTLACEGGAGPSSGAMRVITSIRLPGSAATYVDVDPNTNKVFTSGGASNGQQVAMIDGSTNRVVSTLGTGSGAHVNPATGKVYAAGVYSGSIYVYSSVDGHLITTVKGFGCPVETAVDSSRNQIWGGAQCGGNNDPVFRIDGSADTLTSGEIGSGGVMSKIMVNPVTHVAYVFAGSGGEGKVDANGLTRAAVPFSAVVSAVNPRTNRMYGTAIAGSGVEVIDGSTDAVLAALPVSSPGPMAVNATRNRVYVVDNSPSPPALKVFDGVSNALLGSMALSAGDSSATMAVNSYTGTIYLLVSNAGVPSLLVLSDGL